MVLAVESAEFAIAGGEVKDCFVERRFVELGPAAVSHPDLGVADLPQQKIADSHFPGRANQQVRVGKSRRVKPLGNRLLVNLFRGQTACCRLRGNLAARPP